MVVVVTVIAERSLHAFTCRSLNVRMSTMQGFKSSHVVTAMYVGRCPVGYANQGYVREGRRISGRLHNSSTDRHVPCIGT
jgi:hypothetical protein